MHEPPPESLLEVRDLRVRFPRRAGAPALARDAVDGVSFSIARGQALGLVGESGSGKSTVGRAILRLIPAVSGAVVFDGVHVLELGGGRLRALRPRMQIIFQDPAGALNPRMRVGAAIAEPLLVHKRCPRGELSARVRELLERVGMDASSADRYPHQFSGGQRQRIVIARALALSPELLICDEPTSALDVSIQAQILNLLMDLKARMGLTLLFISHDMAVVQHVCDRIAVMQAGRIVELGEREQVLRDPRHEYTQRLLAAVPVLTTT